MRPLVQARLGMLLLVVTVFAGAGCHTALQRPPAICQCAEDRWGDMVDCKQRTTSISNPTLNRRTTQHYRSHRMTRALGRCIMTGGPHWCF